LNENANTIWRIIFLHLISSLVTRLNYSSIP